MRIAILFCLFLHCSAIADNNVIVIDPGHGGSAVAGTLSDRTKSSSNNAATPGGLLEKDLTLEFSKILREEIHRLARARSKKIGVILTREEDRNLDFSERARICHHPDAACVVSIHFNAGGGGKALGSLALIAARDRNPSYDLDHEFGKGLAAACSFGVQRFIPESKSRGVVTDGHLHGGLGSNFYFQMLRYEKLRQIPKCFLEVEFIDNPLVEERLLIGDRTKNFREIAVPIAAFLLDWVENGASGQDSLPSPANESPGRGADPVRPEAPKGDEPAAEKKGFRPFRKIFEKNG